MSGVARLKLGVVGEPWRASAPCASVGGDLWFPEHNTGDSGHGADAKRICARCPYKAPCQIGAVQRGEGHGIWGGLTVRQLRAVRRELAVAA